MRVRRRNNEYSGAFDCVKKIVKNEGVTALWKGFTPYFFRLDRTPSSLLCSWSS